MSETGPNDPAEPPENEPAEHAENEPAAHPADQVTADGSPVAVYLAVPPGQEATLVHGELDGPSTILELGAGAGRVTRVLVAYGHDVVAVDDSPQMLAHVTGARTICQDLYALDLDRRFDAVVAGSHLINEADPALRHGLLEVAAAHVRPDGVVLLERHLPAWAADPVSGTGHLGPVEVTISIEERRPASFAAVVTYRLGERSWDQSFEAAPVDDEDLAELAHEVGLRLDGYLDDEGRWVRLRPVEGHEPKPRVATQARSGGALAGEAGSGKDRSVEAGSGEAGSGKDRSGEAGRGRPVGGGRSGEAGSAEQRPDVEHE